MAYTLYIRLVVWHSTERDCHKKRTLTCVDVSQHANPQD